MKSIPIIAIIVFVLMFVFCIKQLWKEWKEERKPSPAEDDLFMISYKIENSLIDDKNELHLLDEIKKLKLQPDIDQERLQELEIKFRQRYQILHINDVR